MKLNPLDLVLLAFFGLAVFDGIRRGFGPYATELASLLFALALAFTLFQPLAWAFEHGASVPRDTALIGSFLVLLILGHAIGLTVARRSLPLDRASRALRSRAPFIPVSALPAVGTALTVSALVLSALLVVPSDSMRTLILGSTVGSALTSRTTFVRPELQTLLEPVTAPRGSVAGHTQTPTGEDFYRLHLPSHLDIRLDVQAENRMLDLVNQSRAKEHLKPLRMDPLLQKAAREHSFDMFERSYFSHLTPENRTPFDRITAAGVRYVTAGENIAFAPDIDTAESSLMTSPDHRANILNPDFTRVGIGVYRAAGGYEEMFTQDFAD